MILAGKLKYKQLEERSLNKFQASNGFELVSPLKV